MRWEELKVYKPLTKDELKPAFKDFTKIIADNLRPFGFSLHGRKLIALSNDLLHIIHIDTRGSWSGVSEYFKTEISLVVATDKSPIIRGFELTGSKMIENIAVGIRDNYRVTKEYNLLADFLTRKILENVIPYFHKYDSSLKVLKDKSSFKLGDLMERNDGLILHSELQNKTNFLASKIVDQTLTYYKSIEQYTDKAKMAEYFEELEIFKRGLQHGDWTIIEQKLADNKAEVFAKLKIKPAGNSSLAKAGRTNIN